MLPKINPTTTQAWFLLKKHHEEEMNRRKMKDLFAADAGKSGLTFFAQSASMNASSTLFSDVVKFSLSNGSVWLSRLKPSPLPPPLL